MPLHSANVEVFVNNESYGVGFGSTSPSGPRTVVIPLRWDPSFIFAPNANTTDHLVVKTRENCGENGGVHTGDFKVNSVEVDVIGAH